MKSSNEVLFAGYYGQRNAGDDVFCAVAAGVVSPILDCRRPAFLARRLPSLPVAARPVLARWPGRSAAIGVSRAVERCKHAILFGGSTLTRISPYREMLAERAKQGKLRLYALGVSIGPFASRQDETNVARFLANCSLVAVRDYESKFRAEKLGLQSNLMGDPAVLFPTMPWVGEARLPSNDSPTRIAVSTMDIQGDAGGRAQDLLQDSLAMLASRINIVVDIVVMNGQRRTGDRRASDALKMRLTEQGVTADVSHYSSDPRVLFRRIARSNIYIGLRLHGSVLAYAANRPFVMLGYHEKCFGFARSVACEPYAFNPQRASADEISECLVASLRTRDRTSLDLGEAQRRAWLALKPLSSGAVR